MSEDGRWLAVPVDLLTPRHGRHPRNQGEEACRQFAYLDLVAQARWCDGEHLDRGEFVASRRFLADRWNWSKSRVGRFLRELEEEGEIERLGTIQPPGHLAGHFAGQQAGHLKVCQYSRYEAPRDTLRDTSRDSRRDKVHQGKEHQGKEHTTDAGREDAQPDLDLTGSVERVWQCYLKCYAEKFGEERADRLELTASGRGGKIRARLREGYSVEELQHAIKGNFAAPWYRERDKHELEFILRNQSKVEKFLNKYERNGGPPEERPDGRDELAAMKEAAGE